MFVPRRCYTKIALVITVVLLPAVNAASGSNGCKLQNAIPDDAGGPTKVVKLADREVRVSLPRDYRNGLPAPVIMAFHDRNMTASEFEDTSYFSRHSWNPDAIVVYPQSIKDRWLSDEEPDAKNNDLAFVERLLDDLSENMCVDTDKIYATGLGTGAGFAHLIACNQALSKKFAAYAMVNGAFYGGAPPAEAFSQKLSPGQIEQARMEGNDDIYEQDFSATPGGAAVDDSTNPIWAKCEPGVPHPRILSIHGQDNSIYEYFAKEQGTDGRAGIVQWIVGWAVRNGCGASFGNPEELPENEDHLTRLQRGSLTEGYLLDEAVIRASYRCWARSLTEIDGLAEKLVRKYDDDSLEPWGDIKTDKAAAERFALQRLEQVVAGAEETYKKLAEARKAHQSSARTAVQKAETVAYGQKGSEVVKHLAVQNAGHGWLRLSLDKKTKSWVPLGSQGPENDGNASPKFDSTLEVLKWFQGKSLNDVVAPDEVDEENIEEMLHHMDEESLTELLKHLSKRLELKDKIKEQLQRELEIETDSSKKRARERKEVRERWERDHKDKAAKRAKEVKDEL